MVGSLRGDMCGEKASFRNGQSGGDAVKCQVVTLFVNLTTFG